MQRSVNPFLAALIAGSSLFANAWAEDALPRVAAAAGAKLYCIEPQDGAKVGKDFSVKFGLAGMGVAPAGVDFPDSGHHHLLVDVDSLPDMGQPIAFSEQSLHFGGGQTEARISLPPGKHTLQLLLGDKNHMPFAPPLISERIEITVE